jgi:hypothetical protein
MVVSRRRAWLLLMGAGFIAIAAACNELLGIEPPNRVAEAGVDAAVEGASDAISPMDTGLDAGDACSADPSTDKHNCGKCGHDCLGGECVASMCQPVTVVSRSSTPLGIAVTDGGVLFFSTNNDSLVSMCPVSDCSNPVTIAMGQEYTRSLAVDTTSVYWASAASMAFNDAEMLGNVATCGLSGCPQNMPTILGKAVPAPADVAVDSNYVYWTSDYGVVSKCALPVCAGGPIPLDSEMTSQSGIAVDDTSVYWAEPVAGRVMKCSLSGCSMPAPFASGQASPTKVVVANHDLFWTNYGYDGGAVMTCPTAGCSSPTVFAADQPGAFGIAADSTTLYFSLYDIKGQILACPLSGCAAPVVLASGQHSPSVITVDSVSVYWVTINAVMRVAKP